ncbi:histidine--tRNA ligase [Marinobacterium weihaiense]|uniref:Histidine--tRNA ligase n=1 Tax=Marinobacterium weihaiense TaxID=2851016 RepID=A0ABS6MCP5_9GAMM|nr:histidine--tRNA ligase [Marinobacterium weihaiense]MBV0934077.1 histidine--tRNA ligase [Marinobacterium weihaiense]
MNDILPEHTPVWQYLEATIKRVVGAYGYSEIRMPIVEQTDLFKRSIGEVTDIVEKEMYTFDDRNGESLTLRPEGTACCVRAGEEHGLLYNQTQRLWYMGPMFRYEKPQKGRYRQFHQVGVEAFGMASADVDAELILLTAELWRQLGMNDAVTLQLNSLGSNEARARYRDALVTYLREHFDALDEDSQRRLDSNPLRVLDSKNEATRVILEQAPVLTDYLDEESARDFAQLREILDAAGIKYEVNPYLVRGLDYYCKTVFEWVTDALGAQGTVCAGGRYDGLVKQLGGKPTPAVGFAMGLERLILLLEAMELVPVSARQTFDVYLAAEHKGIQTAVMLMAEELRRTVPGLRVRTHCAGLKNIATKARQTGAPAIILLKQLDGGELQGSLWCNDETEYDLVPEQLKARLLVLFGA